jgi:hypothetical protein
MNILSASEVTKTACLAAVRSAYVEGYDADEEGGAWRHLRVRCPADAPHLGVSRVAGRDRRRTSQVAEAYLSENIRSFFAAPKGSAAAPS